MTGRLTDAERAAAGLSTPTGGLVIDGKRVPVPGVAVCSWLDDPARAPRVTDGATRKVRPVAVVLHTSRGVVGKVREGSRPSTRAEVLARYQTRTERQVSWCLTIDTDGDVLQQCDASTWTSWHAGWTNRWSVGIELIQQADTGDLWRVQVDAAVRVVAALCDALAIPRRVPVGADGRPAMRGLATLRSKAGGGREEVWAGVFGHVHCAPPTGGGARGPGDPGPAVFDALLAAGFEGVVLP